MQPLVTDIQFKGVERNGSHIGFVSFLYDENIAITNVAVHEKLDKSGIRLVYPQNKDRKKPFVFPINRKSQQEIEKIVNEKLKGTFHDKSTSTEPNFNNKDTYDQQLG